jgi:hypothetical protein
MQFQNKFCWYTRFYWLFSRIEKSARREAHKILLGHLESNQRRVAPSAPRSLGCVTIVKRYKSVHKNCQKINKNVKFLCFSFKNNMSGSQKYLNFFPGGLKSFWFHLDVQECRFHPIIFFEPSKWPINYLTGSIYPKIAKIHKLRRPPWTSLSWILKNGFQIRIQRIEIERKPFW